MLDLLAGDQDVFFASTLSKLKARQPSEVESRLKNNFHKWWVELSYIDDSEAQEKEMNNFFKDLSALNFAQDKTLLYKFCDVMVRTSIDLTLFTRDGQMRTNNNTLDYRLVDSFIKLVVVLLGSFDLNK